MDLIRYPYRKQAVMFRDNPTPVTIRWYPAHPDAPTLGYPSGIMNVMLEPDKEWIQDTLGEIWDGPVEPTWGKVPRGINGEHVCGTEEDFAIGGHYDDTLPPVRYGSYGWPLCCDPPVRLKGGGGVGGRCLVEVKPRIRFYGGAGAGGRCLVQIKPPIPFDGGLLIGGDVNEQVRAAEPVEGGLLIGGNVNEQFILAGPQIRDFFVGTLLGTAPIVYPTRVAGDTLLVFFGSQTPNFGPNSGWTMGYARRDFTNSWESSVFRTISDGVDAIQPTTTNWASGAGYISVSIRNGINQSRYGATGDFDVNIPCPSVLVTTAPGLMLCCYGAWAPTATLGLPGLPAGQTLLAICTWALSGTTVGRLAIGTEDITATGNTGLRIGNISPAARVVGGNTVTS